MPVRNVIKKFKPNSYYHIYNRGVAKQVIFHDAYDKNYFLVLLDRHLNSNSKITDRSGVPYKKYCEQLELVCYCLMGNHFHLMVYVKEDPKVLSEFMRSIGTAYTMYYNLRYKRVGHLFQGTYKASLITTDEYLLHITRYIHLNPRRYRQHEYSSLGVYLGDASPLWLDIARISELFDGDSYGDFVDDYEGNKLMLDEIKSELADK